MAENKGIRGIEKTLTTPSGRQNSSVTERIQPVQLDKEWAAQKPATQ